MLGCSSDWYVASVKGDQRGLGLLNPCVEVFATGHDSVEVHVGKAGAAESGRQAGISAGGFGDQMQLGAHPGHGVDLAAELRDEE